MDPQPWTVSILMGLIIGDIISLTITTEKKRFQHLGNKRNFSPSTYFNIVKILWLFPGLHPQNPVMPTAGAKVDRRQLWFVRPAQDRFLTTIGSKVAVHQAGVRHLTTFSKPPTTWDTRAMARVTKVMGVVVTEDAPRLDHNLSETNSFNRDTNKGNQVN
jgi:hypothetical protein